MISNFALYGMHFLAGFYFGDVFNDIQGVSRL